VLEGLRQRGAGQLGAGMGFDASGESAEFVAPVEKRPA
jgi:hypothetical protein